MSHPLDDCRLRLEGAHDHLEAIKTQIADFLGQNPYRAVGEFNQDRTEYVVKMRVAQERPRRLSNAVGDFFHNLRSALDQMAYALAIPPGADEAPPGTEFPIFKDRDLFYKVDGKGNPHRGSGLYKMRGITDPHQRTVFEQVQPFNGTGDPDRHPLWILQEFSVIDKHRKPHLTGALLEDSSWGIIELYGVDLNFERSGLETRVGPFNDGTVVGKVQVRITMPDPVMHVHYDFTFDVAFDPKGPARGAPVKTALVDLLGFVESDVVAKLEPLV